LVIWWYMLHICYNILWKLLRDWVYYIYTEIKKKCFVCVDKLYCHNIGIYNWYIHVYWINWNSLDQPQTLHLWDGQPRSTTEKLWRRPHTKHQAPRKKNCTDEDLAGGTHVDHFESYKNDKKVPCGVFIAMFFGSYCESNVIFQMITKPLLYDSTIFPGRSTHSWFAPPLLVGKVSRHTPSNNAGGNPLDMEDFQMEIYK
jgi:hypothetical protein